MKRLIFNCANSVRKIYWKISKPLTIGVRVIIVNANNELLLVKTHYSNQWYLPGGDVKKLELPENAIKRETKEECSIDLDEIDYIGVYSNFYESKSDHIILFFAKVDNKSAKANFEIAKCQFFDFNSLPAETSPGTKRRIEEYRNNCFKNGKW